MNECAMIASELVSTPPLEALLIGAAVAYFICRYDIKSLFVSNNKT